MHYFAAMSRWDGRSDALCRPRFRALRALCREVHQLRHADQARQRLQLQREILAFQTPIYAPKTMQIRSEKSAQTPAKPHIVNLGQPQIFFVARPPLPGLTPNLPGNGEPRDIEIAPGGHGVAAEIPTGRDAFLRATILKSSRIARAGESAGAAALCRRSP